MKLLRSAKIFISAGEASGDALGAALLAALEKRAPGLEAFGMGGPAMRAEGFEAWRDATEVSVVGFTEVINELPRLFALRDELALKAIERRPALAVLIDVPDFNIRVAKMLHAAGIPVVFYVGPSVWAWRSGRTRQFRRFIDRLLVLFPFEVPIWRQAGVDVVHVGHPLRDQLAGELADVERGAKDVVLLPGSRRGEIDRLLAPMLAACLLLRARGHAERFFLPVAPTLDFAWMRARVEELAPGLGVELVAADAELRRRAIAGAQVALVASGTATLETALIGTPQVIVYRVSRVSWWIGKLLARVKHLGLVNLIAGREIAPELLQDALTAESLADAASALLQDRGACASMRAAYADVRAKLGPPGAADRAAKAVLELLSSS